MQRLLPCPFCGGEPDWMDTMKPEGERFIACTNDGCFGPATTGTGADAVDQWNTRRCPQVLPVE